MLIIFKMSVKNKLWQVSKASGTSRNNENVLAYPLCGKYVKGVRKERVTIKEKACIVCLHITYDLIRITGELFLYDLNS